MSPTPVTLRPVCAGEEPFLFDLYASTRLGELTPLDWSAELRAAFLAWHFNAQQRYFQVGYAGADFQVILLDDRPIGRLYVARQKDEIRVIDITILPEYRNAGIGSRLLGELLDEATRAGKPVRVHVEKSNPALHLYERLGFAIVDSRGVYWLMERSPRAVDEISLERGSHAPGHASSRR